MKYWHLKAFLIAGVICSGWIQPGRSQESALPVNQPEESPQSLPVADASTPKVQRLKEFQPSHTRAEWLVQTPAPAPAADSDEEEEDEEEITVTGTRSPRPVRLSPADISVIDEQKIERFLMQDLRDLFKYEPNVSVGNNRRYGLQDITIRGIGGNRVLLQVDGIRLPGQFQFGTPSIGRDYVDLDTLQRVEVIRGPASALYGSDALGGVVTFKTLDAADVLERFGRQDALTTFSTQYDTNDRSWVNSAAIAFRSGAFESLLGYTRRDGNEARVPTGNQFVDPRTNSRDNYLIKLGYNLTPTSKFLFTTEIYRNRDNFNVAAITAPNLIGPAGFRGQGESLENNTRRDRFSLGYTYNDPTSTGFLTSARVQVYFQNAQVEEERTQDFVRTGAGADRRRVRNLSNEFTDRVFGGEIQLQSTFRFSDSILNKLTYGIDISSTFNDRTRDGIETQFNAAGSVLRTTNVVGADSFPVKDFPDSTTFRLGIYVQDEIEFANTLILIPGIRFDSYSLKTSPDAIYARNVGAVAADLTASAVSPNLGVVWRVTPEVSITGRYARGFRAPLYSEINAGFTNLTSPTFRYKTLSNPDLKPENSDTFEVGVRGGFRQVNFSVTGFYNNYNNFIETFAAAGTDFTIVPGRPVQLFKSQNIGKARTYGFELSGEYRFSPENHGFSILTAIGYTIGDDLVRNQPLESVDPFKAVVGLRYRAPENKWGAELAATFVGTPRTRDRAPGLFQPEGYATVDAVGYYNFTPLISLNFGLFNLFNTQYFQYSDVRPLLDSPEPRDIARFAQPGLGFRVGLTWRF